VTCGRRSIGRLSKPETRFPMPMRTLARLLATLLLAIVLGACARTEVIERPIDDATLNAKVLEVIRKNPAVILDAIATHQREQQLAQQKAEEAALAARLAQLDLATVVDGSPTRGAPAGKRLLVEFSDFQCPFCARAQGTLAEFMRKHGTEVTLVFKHLPIAEIHPEAVPAARAAWAAQQQGKFWEFHDLLFAAQDQLRPDAYAGFAKSLGLDVARFERDRASEAAAAAVERDLALANRLGIHGTPFFLLDREPVQGAVPLAQFEAALARAKAAAAPPPPKP
jgi:protein-disulfide isomerase